MHRPLIRPVSLEPPELKPLPAAVTIPPPPAKSFEREKFFKENRADGMTLAGHMRGLSLDSRNGSSSRSASTDLSEWWANRYSVVLGFPWWLDLDLDDAFMQASFKCICQQGLSFWVIFGFEARRGVMWFVSWDIVAVSVLSGIEIIDVLNPCWLGSNDMKILRNAFIKIFSNRLLSCGSGYYRNSQHPPLVLKAWSVSRAVKRCSSLIRSLCQEVWRSVISIFLSWHDMHVCLLSFIIIFFFR